VRRTAPLRHYAYVLVTIWAITAVTFAVVDLAAEFPLLAVAVPVFVVVTLAGVFAIRSQR
jgi:hypothetical protein